MPLSLLIDFAIRTVQKSGHTLFSLFWRRIYSLPILYFDLIDFLHFLHPFSVMSLALVSFVILCFTVLTIYQVIGTPSDIYTKVTICLYVLCYFHYIMYYIKSLMLRGFVVNCKLHRFCVHRTICDRESVNQYSFPTRINYISYRSSFSIRITIHPLERRFVSILTDQ